MAKQTLKILRFEIRKFLKVCCNIFLQNPDVPDNFKKYKTKTIPKNIILSKSKYDLKTRYESKNLLYFDVISTS